MKICFMKKNQKKIKIRVKKVVVSFLASILLVTSTPIYTYAIAEVAVFTLGDFLWSLFFSAGITFTALETASAVQDLRNDPSFGISIYDSTTADDALRDVRGHVDDSGLCHLFWVLQPEDYGGGSDPSPSPSPDSDSLFKKVFDFAKQTGTIGGASALSLATLISQKMADDESLSFGLSGGIPFSDASLLADANKYINQGYVFRCYTPQSNGSFLFFLSDHPIALRSASFDKNSWFYIYLATRSEDANYRRYIYNNGSWSIVTNAGYSTECEYLLSSGIYTGLYASGLVGLGLAKADGSPFYISPVDFSYSGSMPTGYNSTGQVKNVGDVAPVVSPDTSLVIPDAQSIKQYINNVSTSPQTVYQNFENTYVVSTPQPTPNPYPTYAPAPTTMPRPTSTPEQVEDNTQNTTAGMHLEEIFPFCIPFDIIKMFESFTANRQAPHIQWHYHSNFFDYDIDIDLDFSMFDSTAALLRTLELIIFVIGLALLTKFVLF